MDAVIERRTIKVCRTGNIKCIIIPVEWLRSIFGSNENLLNKYLDISYDHVTRVIKITKGIDKKLDKKLKKVGSSFYIPIKINIFRHMFHDVFDLNFKTKGLMVLIGFDGKTITVSR